MQFLISILVSFLTSDLVKTIIPSNIRPYLDQFDKVAPLAAEAIRLANQIAGADDATKRNAAAQHLLKLLQDNHLDIPGNADLQVCELLVEGVYQGLKRAAQSFRSAK